MEIERCRDLISSGRDLSDEQIRELADLTSALAAAIVDAYTDLNQIDQAMFDPPGSVFENFDQHNSLEKAK